MGSTRPNRFSEKPAHYIFEELKKEKDVEVELIDLRDWPLPFYDEAGTPSMLKGNYVNEVGRNWVKKIDEADGFIVVTPEYTHGYPAVLKNAFDWVFHEWFDKPIGFVSYGTVMGSRAVEQLRQVVIELRMHPIRSSIHLPSDIFMALMKESAPVNPEFFKPLREGRAGDRVKTFFDELIRLTQIMKTARKENPIK